MSLTLTALISRIRSYLKDNLSEHYSDEDITNAIRQAAAIYSTNLPQLIAETVTLTATSKTQPLNLAGLSGSANTITHVISLDHYPSYSLPLREGSGIGGIPINAYYLYHASGSPTLQITELFPPNAGDAMDIRYTATHTINGLDNATVTTIPLYHLHAIIIGSAAIACNMRALSLTEAYGSRASDNNQLTAWSNAQLLTFLTMLQEYKTSFQYPPITARWTLDQWDRPT